MRVALVLVVEDEALVRLGIRHALTKAGYRVLEARDKREAVAAWERENGDIDLVIADLYLPVSSGRDLADVLGAERRRVPFLYISAHPASLVRDRGWLDAGEPFLQKPFAHETLVTMVRSILQRSGDEPSGSTAE